MKYKDIRKDLKKRLSSSRYRHTLGVVDTAARLAKIYGCDVKEARYAALLHDCAKYMDSGKKIDLCAKYGVLTTEAELANPSLLHAKCGAILARHRYGIRNEKILRAIALHTTGAPDMNLLERILFVSDYIEPGRKKAPHLKKLRSLARKDLDQTVYYILKDTVSYLSTRPDQTMDPTTIKAYNYYRTMIKGA